MSGQTRAELVLNYIEASAAIGATMREIQEATGAPTIEVMAVLQGLLCEGRIVRLAVTRRDWPLYVLPGDVRGREISKRGVAGMAVSHG